MKKSLFLTFIILSVLSIASCSNKKLPKVDLTIASKNGQTYTVHTEIARTAEERNHGYMERKNIPEGTGMIFIFEKDQKLSFWMKNTPTPLSIAFIDSKGVIRDIFDMTPFSLSPIVSTVSVRYALEVPQGWYKKNNITTGDVIDLSKL